MIRHPLGLRLNPDRPIRDQIQGAARVGARGVVLDAIGDLSPKQLGETGRRELRHLLRTLGLSLVALGLPVRRALDTTDQLDERIRRADLAFALAYELGTSLVLAPVGPVPAEADEPRRYAFTTALSSLAQRADHRGVRLALETGSDSARELKAFLEALDTFGLAASIDPSSLLRKGVDPVAAIKDLADWVAHAYTPTTAGTKSPSTNPRRLGIAPGGLDWEAYLGALEEIGYRGFLTLWPDPQDDPCAAFTALAHRIKSFG
jgi:sugar phosphate isomerase/epimerase